MKNAPDGVIDQLVVMGATGDLATRHLLPALALLLRERRLPSELRVLGVGRKPLTDKTYRKLGARALAEHAPGINVSDRAALVRRMGYLHADLRQRPDLRAVVGVRPVIAYLALPPSEYPRAVQALRAGGLAPGSRIVVEKPFGEDLESARELSRLLHAVCPERDVFRVDHFLHHQTVQDLLALRLANPFLESLWNREHIERVEITWEETAGAAGRVGYYDGVGALRDMVQSHLLQIVALIAMDIPAGFEERSLRDAKAAALRRVHALTTHQVATRTARGRYTAGSLRGQPRRGYLQELGVDAARGTETYAYLRLTVDDPNWSGVPFVLRTGKALGRPRRRISLFLRTTPRGVLSAAPAVLSFDMGPDRVTFDLAGAGSNGLPAVAPFRFETSRPSQPLPASARLLEDVMAGNPTLAVRDDEVEESWRIVDSVLAGWRAGVPPLQDYPAGSAGPDLPVE